MKMYGIYAVLMGLCGPIVWCIRSYYLKKCIKRDAFVVVDLAIDHKLIMSMIQSLLFVIYLTYSPFKWSEFIEGGIVGICFLCGTTL